MSVKQGYRLGISKKEKYFKIIFRKKLYFGNKLKNVKHLTVNGIPFSIFCILAIIFKIQKHQIWRIIFSLR